MIYYKVSKLSTLKFSIKIKCKLTQDNHFFQKLYQVSNSTWNLTKLRIFLLSEILTSYPDSDWFKFKPIKLAYFELAYIVCFHADFKYIIYYMFIINFSRFIIKNPEIIKMGKISWFANFWKLNQDQTS